MADEKQRKAFLSTLWPLALAAAEKTGVDPRIVMAQSAVETAWGTAAPNNNYFGIKDFSGGGALLDTQEERGGKRQTEKHRFRVYEDPAQSFSDYASFINGNSRYKPVREAKSFEEQIAALGKSGYATASNYGDLVGGIARGLSLDPGVQAAPMQGVVRPMPPTQAIAPAPGIAEAGLAGGQGWGGPEPMPGTPEAAPAAAKPAKERDYYAMASKAGAGLLSAAAPAEASWQPMQAQAHRPNMQFAGLLNPFTSDSQINPFKRRGLL